MLMDDLQITRSRLCEAEAIARRMPSVLQRRGLRPVFSDWLVTADHGLTWLFGVLDLRRIERLEQYTQPDLLHHVSTAIGGRPVYLSNSNGLRYAVLLSAPPRLPQRVDFPGLQRGQLLLGQRYTGEALRVPWNRLGGHLLVAGMTRSGKSAFLRLLVYQALAEGSVLGLGDLDSTTFPMLAEHPALLTPLAHTPQAMLALVERALGECDHRAALYRQVSGYPETLDEYNAQITREGGDPLPRVLVVLDEFNAAANATGGDRGALASAAATLGWRGLKFGLALAFAAQDFSKAIVGRVRDQVGAIVGFRVRSTEIARAIGIPDAARIPLACPGRAITDRWGPLQAYYLDKSLLLATGEQGITPALTPLEQRVVAQAQQGDGRITLALLQELGLGKRQAERLLGDWRTRGWVLKDPNRQNAHYATPKLEALAGNRETRETA